MSGITGIFVGGDSEHVYKAVQVQPPDDKVTIDGLR